MAKKPPKKKTAQVPTKAQVASARARMARRRTKPPGLVAREKQLASARRELKTIRATGVARGGQITRAESAVESAVKALDRQRRAARAAGRPSG